MFEIRYDNKKIKRLERELAGFPRSSLPKVMSRGLNRTASEARTKVGRMISQETGLKVKTVRDRVSLVRASYTSWRSIVKISRRRIPLYNFSARQTGKGVTYKKGGTRVLIRHAFEATMKSGHTGVFHRARHMLNIGHFVPMVSKKSKEAIYELKGPSLGQVFVSAQDRADAIYRESMQRLERNIHDQVNLILKARLPA